jgi:hypothetical protein
MLASPRNPSHVQFSEPELRELQTVLLNLRASIRDVQVLKTETEDAIADSMRRLRALVTRRVA